MTAARARISRAAAAPERPAVESVMLVLPMPPGVGARRPFVGWTDEAVAGMWCMRAAGMSFAALAAELGCSRNAAIGKAHRLRGWHRAAPAAPAAPVEAPKAEAEAPKRARVTRPPKPAEPPKPTRPPKPAPYRAPIVAKPQAEAEAEAMDDPSAGVRFLDLAHDGCRYPLGERLARATHFCGEPAATGRPYCGKHCVIAYQPPRQARANAEMSA